MVWEWFEDKPYYKRFIKISFIFNLDIKLWCLSESFSPYISYVCRLDMDFEYVKLMHVLNKEDFYYCDLKDLRAILHMEIVFKTIFFLITEEKVLPGLCSNIYQWLDLRLFSDKNVKPQVQSFDFLSEDLKEPTRLTECVGYSDPGVVFCLFHWLALNVSIICEPPEAGYLRPTIAGVSVTLVKCVRAFPHGSLRYKTGNALCFEV